MVPRAWHSKNPNTLRDATKWGGGHEKGYLLPVDIVRFACFICCSISNYAFEFGRQFSLCIFGKYRRSIVQLHDRL